MKVNVANNRAKGPRGVRTATGGMTIVGRGEKKMIDAHDDELKVGLNPDLDVTNLDGSAYTGAAPAGGAAADEGIGTELAGSRDRKAAADLAGRAEGMNAKDLRAEAEVIIGDTAGLKTKAEVVAALQELATAP